MEIDDTIKEIINKADTIIIFLSPSLFATTYVTKIEFTLIRQRISDIMIIPVLIEPCDWKGVDLVGGRTACPEGGRKAIVDYDENEREKIFDKLRDDILEIAAENSRGQTGSHEIKNTYIYDSRANPHFR